MEKIYKINKNNILHSLEWVIYQKKKKKKKVKFKFDISQNAPAFYVFVASFK
jgi:hypothetical protein